MNDEQNTSPTSSRQPKERLLALVLAKKYPPHAISYEHKTKGELHRARVRFTLQKDEKLYAIGSGNTVEAAEENAAEKMLDIIPADLAFKKFVRSAASGKSAQLGREKTEKTVPLSLAIESNVVVPSLDKPKLFEVEIPTKKKKKKKRKKRRITYFPSLSERPLPYDSPAMQIDWEEVEIEAQQGSFLVKMSAYLNDKFQTTEQKSRWLGRNESRKHFAKIYDILRIYHPRGIYCSEGEISPYHKSFYAKAMTWRDYADYFDQEKADVDLARLFTFLKKYEPVKKLPKEGEQKSLTEEDSSDRPEKEIVYHTVRDSFGRFVTRASLMVNGVEALTAESADKRKLTADRYALRTLMTLLDYSNASEDIDWNDIYMQAQAGDALIKMAAYRSSALETAREKSLWLQKFETDDFLVNIYLNLRITGDERLQMFGKNLSKKKEATLIEYLIWQEYGAAYRAARARIGFQYLFSYVENF